MKQPITNKRNILIVENQQWQFTKIHDELKKYEDYTLFPNNDDDKKEEYISFIDNVRVWVNENYDFEYRKKALANIEQYIEANAIELIIMDYILGGAHHCLTGIDLADNINAGRGKDNLLPILFLSKTEFTNKEREEGNNVRKKGYNEYCKKFPETSNWLHKGYFGDEILNPAYLKNNVIPSINKTIGISEYQKVINKMGKLLEKSFGAFETTEEHFTSIYEFLISNNTYFFQINNDFKENIMQVELGGELDSKIIKKQYDEINKYTQ